MFNALYYSFLTVQSLSPVSHQQQTNLQRTSKMTVFSYLHLIFEKWNLRGKKKKAASVTLLVPHTSYASKTTSSCGDQPILT